ncbi:MAG: Rab family GTPase [Promethearchaeota archaeon]
MEGEIITAIVYTELDNDIGPNPIFSYPPDLTENVILHISIKTITILSGEHGLIPQSLIIIPFPSLSLKGIIKYMQWKDKNLRGGIGQSAITFIFKETDDLIFYKYKQDLESIFNETAEKIVRIKESNTSYDNISNNILVLKTSVLTVLDQLRIQEESSLKSEALPDRNIQYSEFIDFKFKIVFVGEPGVGKTSMILRFSENAFTRKYIPTLGVNVSDKIFRVNDTIVQLVLWDIAGQPRFQFMRNQFYQGSDGVFLIFDLTNPKSFNRIKNWYQDIKRQLIINPSISGYLIGNKNDLTIQRNINREDADQLAEELNLGYIETSALTGENVISAFYELAKVLLRKVNFGV